MQVRQVRKDGLHDAPTSYVFLCHLWLDIVALANRASAPLAQAHAYANVGRGCSTVLIPKLWDSLKSVRLSYHRDWILLLEISASNVTPQNSATITLAMNSFLFLWMRSLTRIPSTSQWLFCLYHSSYAQVLLDWPAGMTIPTSLR